MDHTTIAELIDAALGVEPESIQRMTFGHSNEVYDIAIPGRSIILRMNDHPDVLAGTEHNLRILEHMALPVPKVITSDLTQTRFAKSYIILNKIPGRDLAFELPQMTTAQMTELAECIISFQRTVATLPKGTGYGWVSIGHIGSYKSWDEIVTRDFERSVQNIDANRNSLVKERLFERRNDLHDYFVQVEPICFLDDITVKNVILLHGKLQGIVDFDCVCYGDPLYMIALTKTGIISDLTNTESLFYIDELCRCWELSEEQKKVVDFYTAIHAMHFIRFHNQNSSGKEPIIRLMNHIHSVALGKDSSLPFLADPID